MSITMAIWQPCAVLCLVVACVEQTIAIKASYERFEQFFGNEYMDFDLRVRKFNRTTMTLNGTIFINQPIDDTILFTSDVFHSRLGNQQFQHYPQHLPTSGLCSFIDNLHRDYPSAIESIENITQMSECPVTERVMHVIDKAFPSEVIPDSLANGLWKMVFSGILNETTVIRFMISVRLTDDYMS
uniref:Uncharacterized protein n=1 Tax=Anopheles epiroticus TaxID=199890 RepID=A0A182PLC3_9DIPT